MKHSFWKGDGKIAWTAKVAVSSTGHAVARNYVVKPTKESDKTNVLRPGDVGITLRLDRLVDGMTPEQRLAAQGLAEAMFKDLMKVLGKEEIEGSGIPIGSYIALANELFRVEKETRIGLHLRKLADGFLCNIELRTWDQLNGVILVRKEREQSAIINSFSRQIWKGSDKPLAYRQPNNIVHIERFYSAWGEDALEGLLSEDFQFRYCFWLDQALRLISDTAKIQRIAKCAKQKDVRSAAQKLLDERQAKATG